MSAKAARRLPWFMLAVLVVVVVLLWTSWHQRGGAGDRMEFMTYTVVEHSGRTYLNTDQGTVMMGEVEVGRLLVLELMKDDQPPKCLRVRPWGIIEDVVEVVALC